MKEIDYLILYRNYLFALEERKIHGEKYGDTKELIKSFEKQLKKVGFQKKGEKTREI